MCVERTGAVFALPLSVPLQSLSLSELQIFTAPNYFHSSTEYLVMSKQVCNNLLWGNMQIARGTGGNGFPPFSFKDLLWQALQGRSGVRVRQGTLYSSWCCHQHLCPCSRCFGCVVSLLCHWHRHCYLCLWWHCSALMLAGYKERLADKSFLEV